MAGMGLPDNSGSILAPCCRQRVSHVSHTSACHAHFVPHLTESDLFVNTQQLPIGAWIGGLIKMAYDRELSISERRVKPADILHNASLILGKQIINILPEG